MLQRVDRVQLAVRDAEAAAASFAHVLGASQIREDTVRVLNARRIVVQAGEAEFELLQPAGEGAVASQLDRWGEGVYAAGFAVEDTAALSRHMDDAGLHFTQEADQIFIEADQTRGMRCVISPMLQMGSPGLITHLYEVTNIVEDHQKTASDYAHAFGLDVSRFVPINSERWGYQGTLTVFDPPNRLDRIELTQITQPSLAMGRFFARRGESLYMCYAEANDLGPIYERLAAGGLRYTGDPDSDASLFIHPTALCGMLMGISRTDQAWRWSGRPELARA